MKTNKLLLGALSAVLLMSWSCARLENFKIDSPSDLADKISEYKEEQAALNAIPEGATEIEITEEKVGTPDEIPGFWQKFSQYFTVPVGKKLVFRFDNSGGENTWNNWDLVVTTPAERGEEGYKEYFVLRSDLCGWTPTADQEAFKKDPNLHLYANEEEMNVEDSSWPDACQFISRMRGAFVEISVDHACEGRVYVEGVSTAKDGTVFTETFNYPVSDVQDINAFLVADVCYYVMRSAYMVDSGYDIIPDALPVSIKVEGLPTAVMLNTTLEEALKGASLTATVTYDDGTSQRVKADDITFTATDDFGKAVGQDVILYSYNLSKRGAEVEKVVTGKHILNVAGKQVGIEAVANAYVIGYGKYVTLSPSAVSVYPVFEGGVKGGLLPLSKCTISFTDNKVVYDAVAGSYPNAFSVKYTSDEGDVYEANGTVEIAASALPAQTTNVGAKDYSNGWWQTFTQDWVVAPGESQTVSMMLFSKGAASFQSPCTILRKADKSEYGVVRMDNWCWGPATGDTDPRSANSPARITLESNWNFEGTYFQDHLNGSLINITVANDGTNASVRYYVVYPDGTETHYQYYDDIPVVGADFQFALVTEASYLDFTSLDPSAAKVASIQVTKVPDIGAYYVYDKPVPFKANGVEVEAVYTDMTKQLLANSELTFSDIPAEDGVQKITVTYNEGITADFNITVVKGTGAVGAPDCSMAWGETMLPKKQLLEGESLSYEMFLYSKAVNAWDGPMAVLEKTDGNLSICRVDRWAVLRGDWTVAVPEENKEDNLTGDWVAMMKAQFNGAIIKITATNNGNSAEVRYDYTWPNGDTNYVLFKNLPVDNAADVYFSVATDSSYAVLK